MANTALADLIARATTYSVTRGRWWRLRRRMYCRACREREAKILVAAAARRKEASYSVLTRVTQVIPRFA